MAIVRKYGKSDLFITVTCNSRWPEIVKNLLWGMMASDMPDLVSKVFILKLRALMRNIAKRYIFGRVEVYVS